MDIKSLIAKIQKLPADKVSAVEEFVDFLDSPNEGLAKAAGVMSAPSFERIWNNPEDDVYDAL